MGNECCTEPKIQNAVLEKEDQNLKINKAEPLPSPESSHQSPAKDHPEHPSDHLHQQKKPEPQEQKIPPQKQIEQIVVPALTEKIASLLLSKKFFEQKFENNPQIRAFGSQVYEGKLNQNSIPHGYGKMYKADKSLFLGHFVDGKAHGEGVYIMSNGSYYEGNFENNTASSENGLYWSEELQYRGGFKNNKFHGKGEEKGSNYKFVGTFTDGYKKEGECQWIEGSNVYNYSGSFNSDGLFDGEGVLKDTLGVYNGHFFKGIKHGKGTYKFANGLVYEGEYNNGVREGNGILYNADNTIAYEGSFKGGFPDGEGFIYNKSGKKMQTKWVDGIDSRILDNIE